METTIVRGFLLEKKWKLLHSMDAESLLWLLNCADTVPLAPVEGRLRHQSLRDGPVGRLAIIGFRS